jgi:RimJ/RimL family protein N-acetyltransferase
MEAVVVIGPSNARRAQLAVAVQKSPARIELRYNVADMPALIRWAEVSVTAGGSTTWERARLGLPGLVLVLADNQEAVATAIETSGVGWNLGWHHRVTETALANSLERLIYDAEARKAMSCRGLELVDGRGAERVREIMSVEKGLWFRPAGEEDARLFWEWANDPIARRWSFAPDVIRWEDHTRWFVGKLADSKCLLLVFADGDSPLGQVRFDLAGREAVISISLANHFRGKGYGTRVLRAACGEVFARPIDSVLALIRPGNEVSIRMFEAVGFRSDGEQTVRGLPALRFSLTR